MAIDKARFRSVVLPGDQMRIQVEILRARAKSAKFKGEIYVGETLVSEAELMCMLAEDGDKI